LSALGEKLIWAERRVIARLGPSMESLTSEINLEIANLLDNSKPVLKLHASHGYAVALLPKHIKNITLDLQYCSTVEALNALIRNASEVAGFHIPIGISTRLSSEFRACLNSVEHQLVRFITRTQGLIVAPGNPLSINNIGDISPTQARFINRQYASGTRALLDALLDKVGLSAADIRGFEQEEFTHSAVAAYIAANMADVGFGVEAAARQFGLDFIPVIQEHYVLAVNKRLLNEKVFKEFLVEIRSKDFLDAVKQLPGYSIDGCGSLCTYEELF